MKNEDFLNKRAMGNPALQLLANLALRVRAFIQVRLRARVRGNPRPLPLIPLLRLQMPHLRLQVTFLTPRPHLNPSI